ncbi:hypothetical protein IW261DRAFT_1610935 [Armillaria novae-zelandiae]|uniref:Uncharacterized protein n=1 Tax=Armillaria novae-zelandiae TaxID=153914 RepID=A0AA39T9H0_9AGAR|nr:hypothetical protein IW261DRAFT_1610935 [Armillaria novae-zelandiae]
MTGRRQDHPPLHSASSTAVNYCGAMDSNSSSLPYPTPKWHDRDDTEDPHSNSPYKRVKNSKDRRRDKTRTRRNSRVAQQDDTVAGSTQDALRSSTNSVAPAGDDSSDSWNSIYDGQAPLVPRIGVCSGNVYYYPEEPTPEPSQPQGHPGNVLSPDDAQSSIIEQVDTLIASYSQRHAGAGDIPDAPFGDDSEPRSNGEYFPDAERSEAYAASEDEFCVYTHHDE